MDSPDVRDDASTARRTCCTPPPYAPRTATVTVFAVNRDQTEPLPLEVALHGLGLTAVVEHSVLADADPDARNTLAEPERVAPHAGGRHRAGRTAR